jgi:hypothetical protein
MTESKLDILIQIRDRLDGLNKSIEGVGRLNKELVDLRKRGADAAQMLQTGLAIDVGGRIIDGFNGVAGAIKGAVVQSVKFAASLETARLGIAAALRQNAPREYETFAEAVGGAGRALDLLKEKARTSQATFGALFAAYQGNAGNLFRAGITDLEKQVNLVNTIGTALKLQNISDPYQILQETRALLTGNGGPDAMLMNQMGLTGPMVKEAIANGTLLELLMGKLQGVTEAAAAAGGTYDIALSNLADTMQQAGAEAAEPLKTAVADLATKLGGAGDKSLQATLNAAGRQMADIVKEAGKLAGALTGAVGPSLSLGKSVLEIATAAAVPAVLIGIANAARTLSLVLGGIPGIAAAAALALVNLGIDKYAAGVEREMARVNKAVNAQQEKKRAIKNFGSAGEAEAFIAQNERLLADARVALDARATAAARGLTGEAPKGGSISQITAYDARLRDAKTSVLAQADPTGEIGQLQINIVELQNLIALAKRAAEVLPETKQAPMGAEEREKINAELAETAKQTAEINAANAAWAALGEETLTNAERERQIVELRAAGRKKEAETAQRSLDIDRLTLEFQTKGIGNWAEANKLATDAVDSRLKEKHAIEAARDAEKEKRDALKAERDYLREQQEILQDIGSRIGNAQSDPFLLQSQRDARLQGLYAEQAAMLEPGSPEAEQNATAQRMATDWGRAQADVVGWLNSLPAAATAAAQALTTTLGSAIEGISAGISGLILGTTSWQQAMQQAGASIVQELVRIGVRLVASYALQSVLQAGAMAQSAAAQAAAAGQAAATGASITAAYAPAAAMAGAATYGTSAGVGTAVTVAAVIAAVGVLAALAFKGFRSGGYTGGGGDDEPAGIVHRGEYVIPAGTVRRAGLANVEASVAAMGRDRGYRSGGYVADAAGRQEGGRAAAGSPILLVDDRRDADRLRATDEFRDSVVASVRRERARVG